MTHTRKKKDGLLGLAFSFVVLAASAFLPQISHAATPAAGTAIGNQASATYNDGSGASRTVTSNTVVTVVQQVASLTLTADGAKTAAVGSTVYYPHTLTNTGNGTDTFSLNAVNAASQAFNMAGITIYPDANGTGVPSGPAITSTGAVAAGAAFKFIVAATIPATATSGQTNRLTVSAASTFNSARTDANTDTTTVTANAVIGLTKAVSVSSGAAGSGPYTYTLTYTNTGNSTATNVTIQDTLPDGITYQTGSGQWSVTGATLFTDAKASYGTSPNTIQYDFAITKAKAVTAVLSQIAPGQSGTLTFQFKIASGTAPGVINNTATVSYNDGSASGTATASSNTTPFTVTQTADVMISGEIVASADPGNTVSFVNKVTNTGNGVDTFNITLAGSTFPAGTSFVLYKSDGVTPLVDTNGDGTADTGPLAAGATYNVIVKAVLPTSASGTGPFIVNKTATSAFDANKAKTAVDQLTTVTVATVDLTNTQSLAANANALGKGAGPEAASIKTNTVSPGASTTFILVANNTGPISDSYNLAASTDETFGSQALPSGWTLTFKADGGNGDCSTTGATITSTGTVASRAFVTYCAIASVPASGAGAVAATTQLYFRAVSPATGAVDRIHNAVSVNPVRALTYTPNNTGQVFPAGSAVYSHTLTNNGNVREGNGTVSTIAFTSTNSQSGWMSVQYFDANNDGVLDASDPLVPAAGLHGIAALASGLAPGQSITIFDKVLAPSGVNPGVVNVTTTTFTTANGSYSDTPPAAAVATDSTTVIAGNVTLVKQQALDAGCTGAASNPVYSTANITAGAVPGACILYKITVQNVGSADATGVTVSDATPTYTVYSNVTPAATTQGSVTAPNNGSAGSVTASVGNLTPGQSAVITFGVKIQP